MEKQLIKFVLDLFNFLLNHLTISKKIQEHCPELANMYTRL